MRPHILISKEPSHENENTPGLCQCGCGRRTWVSTKTVLRLGWIKGMPVGFVRGHARKGEANHQWRGDMASANNKRKRARAMYRVSGNPCERCGKPARDRHHKDGNTGNNVPSNISILCRLCHMIVDGRLEQSKARLAEHSRKSITPPVSCVVCGKLAKPTRKGRCSACIQHYARYGSEREKK